MNGITNCTTIDRRPTVTCAGELEVFSGLEDALSQALPQDTCEWRRSLGRPVRMVYIGAAFAPFSPAALPKGTQWDLIRQPLFHIYWTECNDIDVYKSCVKDDIESWLKEIQQRDIPDWLIVVVENYDGKRANKLLPRTTVLDKIRTDFAPKQGDRCISVINPGRSESRSADSWKGLVARIRHLLLVSYARAISKLEDHVRQQREKRNEAGWNFMQYFQLQEELAQVLEMLGLYDEALVQYDELDALFSQFVVNGHIGDKITWLKQFHKPIERWRGLKLGPATLDRDPSLLELRAYLFAKQAHMLMLLDAIWKVASRCLPFLHTCVKELMLLEVSAPTGAVTCWLFLACMEVLHACDRYNQADQVESYSAHTASLWEYASQKLRSLGELCGLMPGMAPSSEQLHLVVSLSAGMGDSPGTTGAPSPTDKLKMALSSQDAFHRNYLELAELAMGTYKHIGRLRSARLVGRELSSFYMLLSETQKAAAFLNDILRMFQADGWNELAAQTQAELAECYRECGDYRKFIRASAAVSAAPEIDNLIRWSYFDEMMRAIGKLDKPLVMAFEDVFKIVSVSVKNEGAVMQGSTVEIELVVDSNFPKEVLCTSVSINLETDNKDNSKRDKERSYCNGNILTAHDLKTPNPALQKLKIYRHVDLNEDKQLANANVVSKFFPFKRKDSQIAPVEHDFNTCIEVLKLPQLVTPGVNVIRLSKEMNDVGKYCLGQIAFHVDKFQLVSGLLTKKIAVEVKRVEPSLRLDKISVALLSGLEQVMQLTLTVGSYPISTNSEIKLIASRGLTVHYLPDEPLVSTLEIPTKLTKPFSVTQMPLRVFAELPSKDHSVTLMGSWTHKPVSVALNFIPLLTSSWRLHTVQQRKFAQINITGQSDEPLLLDCPRLDLREKGDAVSLNPDKLSSQVISNGLVLAYTWELIIKSSKGMPFIKAQFSIEYCPVPEDKNDPIDRRTYCFNFDITDYQTLYVVEAKVEPTKGNEFCRVGIMCNLNLTIKQAEGADTDSNSSNSLMYEVLAEPSVWAVCGRTAGVITFESDSNNQLIVLDVMPLTTGYLPLPLIRLSKYIPADVNLGEKSWKADTHPRLEPFSPGQVYNASKGYQVHVITSTGPEGHAT